MARRTFSFPMSAALAALIAGRSAATSASRSHRVEVLDQQVPPSRKSKVRVRLVHLPNGRPNAHGLRSRSKPWPDGYQPSDSPRRRKCFEKHGLAGMRDTGAGVGCGQRSTRRPDLGVRGRA